MLSRFAHNRWLLVVLVTSTLIGAVCAKLNTSGNLQVAAAATHFMIDDPDASIVDRRALTQDVSTLQKRAELYARLTVTQPVLETVARRAGVPVDQLSGVARTTADVPIPLMEPGSEERASQIEDSRAPYRLELQSDPAEPILAVYAQAPSTEAAQRLADSVVLGLEDHLRSMARQQGVDEHELPQLHQLGAARGGVTNSKAKFVIGALTFLTAFTLCFVLLFVLVGRYRRRTGLDVPRPASRARLTGRALADWPRTTRLVPWSIAGLIAMFWLTPFDKIQLAMSTPIDMTLDRIVLPVVAAIWLIALVTSPDGGPRVRITLVHIALGAFLACAFLSVVLDAHALNQEGELMLAFKKLPMLASYMAIFVIVASSVRRTEVPAFLTYTLILAVICGVGIVIEYRFETNLFYSWTQKFLPPIFTFVANGTGDGLDALGRRWIAGPTAYGVEAIGMMAMALPIAIVGIIGSPTRRRQILYGLAIAVLLAAMLATQRKSALIAPVAVIATLAYFRRRELLSLAPLGLVIGVVAAAASPGAVHSVVGQFTAADRSSVATTSDRTADYDAVRPDVWTHLLFGRGFGSYNHDTYRILDSDILGRTVETGVLGLAAFLLIGFSVILVCRKTISSDPRWAPAALCGTAAAVCFLTSSFLYDVMAFPHGTDTFLYMAGLAVAATGLGAVVEAPLEPDVRHTLRDHRPVGRRSGRPRDGSPRNPSALV
jgi:hypothetical protein